MRRPLVRLGLSLALLASTIVVVTEVAAGQVATAATAYSGQCPGGAGQCVEASLPCAGAASSCPTVVVGPTDNLQSDEYVSLSMSNFPEGSIIRTGFCTSDAAGRVVPDPYCAVTPASGEPILGIVYSTVNTNGTSGATIPVVFDPSGAGNTPMAAQLEYYEESRPLQRTFYCDNGPNYCALFVTEETNGDEYTTDTTANTMVIPLDFAPGSLTCPSSDPTVFTDGAFSVEHLIPDFVQATCDRSGGVVALDTATNSAALTSDLAQGGTQIAFTDDPSDPQLQAELAASGTTYDYIPVALSATVVAFAGNVENSETRAIYPVTTYNMTPNMVAGMVTTAYANGGTSDSLVTAPQGHQPPLDCADIVGPIGNCKTNQTSYNTFYLVNPEPEDIIQPYTLGLFFSNTASGATYQLSQWMCSAPNAPFNVSLQFKGDSTTQTVSVTDEYNPATTTFTTPPTQSPFWGSDTPASVWPFTSCSPTSQFPTLSPGSLSQYVPADTPALQAKSIHAYGAGVDLAVGAMDWSEASFNGLDAASLQNAAGNFVAPSENSIDAALADATENADGVYSFDYTASAPDAYPMPMITYAVVPDQATLPTSQAKAITQLITNLVAYSSGKDGSLPGGYVPLTTQLQEQADHDIATDLVSLNPASSATPSATVPSPAIGGAATSTVAASPGSGSTTASSPPATTTPSAASTSSPSSPRRGPAPLVGPAGLDVVLGTRWLLPMLLGLGALALVSGPLLVVLPGRRRRRHQPGAADEPQPSSPGP